MACSKHDVFSAFMLTKYCLDKLEIILFGEKNRAEGCSFLDVHEYHTLVSDDLMRSHSLMHLNQPRKAAKYTHEILTRFSNFSHSVWGGVTCTGCVGFSGLCGGLLGVRRPSRWLRKGYMSEQQPWPNSSDTVSVGVTCWQGCRGLSAWVDHVCVYFVWIDCTTKTERIQLC